MTRATVLNPRAAVAATTVACALALAAVWTRPTRIDPSRVAIVRTGSLTATLTATGTLRPLDSITYRSPVSGRELEIIELAPEGVRVGEGDLVARLDTTDLQRELERARQEARQSALDVQLAEFERGEAEAAVTSVNEGEGALTVEEARTRLQIAQKRADRLRHDYQQLMPLLEKGVITREELKKGGDELEESEQELALARRRAAVLTDLSHPRDRQRAELQLAQKQSLVESARAKAVDAERRLKALAELIESCSIYARRPGMVVYEEFMNATPRRKVRTGDRVTASQGIVTIPEVNRMVLDASVAEAEIHRVRAGQLAAVRVEAFPDARLTGAVTRVGTLARASAERPLDDKRFDVVIELAAAPALELRPDMTARADIVVATRTDVLLVPVTAVFDQRGAQFVHVARGGAIETVAIAVGETDDAMAEVMAGLRDGDRVLLDAPASLIASPVAAPSTAGVPADRASHAVNGSQRR